MLRRGSGGCVFVLAKEGACAWGSRSLHGAVSFLSMWCQICSEVVPDH